MSFSDDDVFEDWKQEPESKNKKKKKNRSTEMFLTLNLNEKFTQMSREQKVKFRDFGVNLFDKRHILSYFEIKPTRITLWPIWKTFKLSGILRLHPIMEDYIYMLWWLLNIMDSIRFRPMNCVKMQESSLVAVCT